MAILDESDFIEESPISKSKNILDESDFLSSGTQEQPLQSGGQALAGGLGNILEGLSLGQADEIIGGGNAALDYAANIFKSGQQPSYSDLFSQRMKESEQLRSQFKQENPVTGYGGEIVGAVANPLNAIKLLKNAGLVGNVAQTGLVQGGIGALYGAGQNQDRQENAAKGFLFGAGAGALGEGLAAGASKVADIATDIGSKFKLSAAGISRADLKAAGKSLPKNVKGVQQQNPLVKAFDEFEQSGGLKEGLDPETLSTVAAQQKAAKDLAVIDIVKAADDVQVPFSPGPLTTNLKPDFSKTEEFIKKTYKGTQQKRALAIFERETKALSDTLENGGTLKDWQAAKLSVQGSVDYKNPIASKVANKVKEKIASNIRQHIEDTSSAILGKEAGQAVKQLNQESGNRAQLLNIFERNKNAALGGNPVNDVMGTINQFRVPIVLGGLTGGGEYVRSGDAGNALFTGLGALALTSKGGQNILGGAARKAGQALESSSPLFSAASKAVAPSILSDESTSNFSLPKGEIMPKADDINLDNLPKKQDKRVAYVERLIDSDPIDAAIYEIESGRNPLAKNPTSSASGAFQLIKNTAKKLGVNDVFDIGENYKGFLKLKEENQAVLSRLGLDPNDGENLYRLHYLGAPVFKKYVQNKPLNEKELAQVKYLESKVMPKFSRVYNKKVNQITEV